jgi:PAS domain S-box-containing protein
VNAAPCGILGYSEQELLNTNWPELTHPGDREAGRKMAERLLGDQSAWEETEKRYLHRSGDIVRASTRISLVRDSAVSPSHFVVHVEDTTQRKQADEALRESEERFRTMADGCPAIMWVNQRRRRKPLYRAYRKSLARPASNWKAINGTCCFIRKTLKCASGGPMANGVGSPPTASRASLPAASFSATSA